MPAGGDVEGEPAVPVGVRETGTPLVLAGLGVRK